MPKTKGIAIRIEKELLDRIDNHEIARNDLIQKAISQFFEKDSKNNDLENNSIPNEIYEDVYNTLYHNEITPLKQDIKSKNDTIELLKNHLDELKEDKKFLQNQLKEQLQLINNTKSLSKRFRKRLSKSGNKKIE